MWMDEDDFYDYSEEKEAQELEAQELEGMTADELKQELLKERAKTQELQKIVESYTDEYMTEEERDEARINRIVAERHAEEDRKNDERAENDELFAYELRCIRYLESRYDDYYGY